MINILFKKINMLNKNKFLKNYFIFNILFLLSNSILKITLNFYPLDNKNFSEPSGIFEYYLDQMPYANFEIGSKRQKVQVPLKFDTNDFYIVDTKLFEYKPKKFSGFKLYNSSNSETHKVVDENTISGYSFEMADYHKDDFYFNNKNYSLDFYIPLIYSNDDSGGIGMQLYPPSDLYDSSMEVEMTFLEKLKLAGLKDKNIWTIFYNSEKNILEDDGFILIGGYPEELNSDLGYYKKDFFKGMKKNINMLITQKIIKFQFDFGFEIDGIYGYKGNKDQLIEDFPNGSITFKRIYLTYGDIGSGGIYLPKALNKFYTDIFEQYIIKEECFKGNYNGYTYNFYYCKKDKNLIKEIKNNFPRIILKSNDFVFNFTLEADDVLIEHNNYVICLIYFSTTSNDIFKLGKPFLKKYLFSFNYEDKNVIFYVPEKKDKNKGVSIIVLVISIIATIIIVSVICFLIFKFILYDKFFRKKRANELNDDDYDYTANENIGKGGLYINNE